MEVLDFCGIDAAQQEKIIEAGFVVAVYTPAAYDKKKATSNMALIHVGEAETPNGETLSHGRTMEQMLNSQRRMQILNMLYPKMELHLQPLQSGQQ